MGQREARLNLEIAGEQRRIAHASKRDSTAMKTISLLGAIFLPGNLLASVFGMSFFNFEDGESTALSFSPTFTICLSILYQELVINTHRCATRRGHSLDLLRLYHPHHSRHRRHLAV